MWFFFALKVCFYSQQAFTCLGVIWWRWKKLWELFEGCWANFGQENDIWFEKKKSNSIAYWREFKAQLSRTQPPGTELLAKVVKGLRPMTVFSKLIFDVPVVKLYNSYYVAVINLSLIINFVLKVLKIWNLKIFIKNI